MMRWERKESLKISITFQILAFQIAASISITKEWNENKDSTFCPYLS